MLKIKEGKIMDIKKNILDKLIDYTLILRRENKSLEQEVFLYKQYIIHNFKGVL